MCIPRLAYVIAVCLLEIAFKKLAALAKKID
jgi:hypothetical protein